jgi:hypothetical protein
MLALLALAGCGSAPDAEGPQTARDKQLQDAKANGEIDDSGGKPWGGWRYQGDRSSCFYVVGRRCFKSKKTACASACGVSTKTASADMCTVDGGGPAAVSCNGKKK